MEALQCGCEGIGSLEKRNNRRSATSEHRRRLHVGIKESFETMRRMGFKVES